MEAAVERVIRAIEALPRDLANEEVASLFAASDRLTARLSSALARIDPAADGAVSVRHWLRSRAERSDHDAGVLVRRAHRLTGCPLVADAWHDGLQSTGQVNAITASVSAPPSTIATASQRAARIAPAWQTTVGAESIKVGQPLGGWHQWSVDAPPSISPGLAVNPSPVRPTKRGAGVGSDSRSRPGLAPSTATASLPRGHVDGSALVPEGGCRAVRPSTAAPSPT
jgi:hypothetical protein